MKTIRDVIMGLLFSAPLVAPLSVWIFKNIRVVSRRSKEYPSLHDSAVELQRTNRDIRANSLDLLVHLSGHELSELSLAFFADSSLYIAFPRTHLLLLNVGETVAVVHTKDALLMGVFEVTEVRNNEYYAVARPGVDLLFASLVREKERVDTFPNLAVLFKANGATS
jgi:hypothetical protein